MARRSALTPVLILAALLAAGAVLPRAALALTLETPQTNQDGSLKFVDPDQKFSRFKDNDTSDRDRDRDGNPRGLSFGSPDNGITLSIGPRQDNDPFNRSRFFGPGPSNRW